MPGPVGVELDDRRHFVEERGTGFGRPQNLIEAAIDRGVAEPVEQQILDHARSSGSPKRDALSGLREIEAAVDDGLPADEQHSGRAALRPARWRC